jgi:hypothetical protein
MELQIFHRVNYESTDEELEDYAVTESALSILFSTDPKVAESFTAAQLKIIERFFSEQEWNVEKEKDGFHLIMYTGEFL